MPKLSIITINYNNLEGLQKTFESVFAQTYQEIEYIVIDGGSTDGSKELIAQNKDKITYWVSEPDKGIYNAMNKGIKVANGEYIIFINSGDTFFNETVVDKLLSIDNIYDIVYGDHNLLKIDGSETVKHFPSLITISYLLLDTVPHLGTRIRKSLFDNNLYEESHKISSDWTWFFDALLQKVSFYHCNFIAVNFRLDGVSFINHNLGMEERLLHLKNKHPDYLLILSKYLEKNTEVINLKKQIEEIYSSRWIRLLKKFNLTKL
ncbi:glycosyltransferase family 2 protein [Cloacibacterium sp.]|uniref:glycosyltransferase family 2 protein n=1 Tax=Cloacibacterium sp. TaxID=1913682 RepID=UPI0039E4CDA9